MAHRLVAPPCPRAPYCAPRAPVRPIPYMHAPLQHAGACRRTCRVFAQSFPAAVAPGSGDDADLSGTDDEDDSDSLEDSSGDDDVLQGRATLQDGEDDEEEEEEEEEAQLVLQGAGRWYAGGSGSEEEYDGLGSEAGVSGSYDGDMGQEGLDADAVDVWEAINNMVGTQPTFRAVQRCFPFALDQFQRQSVEVLLSGQDCVVCAPTGAGKTAIAEAATIATLARGKRVIYTTPLKALSNQKMHEMRALFGDDAVGLQTGDTSLRPDAQIVVMTTEILRNILYRAAEEAAGGMSNGAGGESHKDDKNTHSGTNGTHSDDKNIHSEMTNTTGAVGMQATQDSTTSTSTTSTTTTSTSTTTTTSTITTGALDSSITAGGQLGGIGLVVLDEVHYLADPYRGSVWEEVIINCPPSIQLLAMSATVRNPADLGGWISKVHGPCQTIISKDRPVPLRWHFCHKIRASTFMLPLYASNGRRINQQLLPKEEKKEKRGSGSAIRHLSELDPAWGRQDAGRQPAREPWAVELGEPPSKRVPYMEDVLEILRTRDMLPAIWFIFSRRDCDQAAVRCAESGTVLTTEEERSIIQQEINALQATQPEAIKEPLVNALLAGLASHHAGCLPAWKTLVESLFQQGVLKVVFATETLAAGINMPARTTVINSMARRRGGSVSLLTHNELLQMAGRAGRRGYDLIGHTVLLQTRFDGPQDGFGIIRRGPEPLTSQFTTGYSMVLNLLATRSLDEAKVFVQRSFSQYLGGDGAQRRLEEIAALEASAKSLLVPVANVNGKKNIIKGGGRVDPEAADLERFSKLWERRREERRQLRILKSQVGQARASVVEQQLQELTHGQCCMVKLDMSTAVMSSVDEGDAMPAICLGLVGAVDTNNQEQQWCLCFSADNRILRVGPSLVRAIAPLPANTPNTPLLADPTALTAAMQRIRAFVDSLPPEGGPWTRVDPLMWSVDGNVALANTALKLSKGAPSVPCPRVEVPVELQDAIAAQGARLAEVQKELRALRRTTSKGGGSGARKASRGVARAAKLLEEAKQLRAELDMQLNTTWMGFEAVLNVLLDAGALTPGTLQCLPLGHVARQLNGDNELWMAIVFSHAAVQSLSPAALAGVACALVTPSMVSKPALWVAYPPSQYVVEALEGLQDAEDQLFRLQAQHGVMASLSADLRLAGLVEAWAAGCSWDQLMTDCSLDDGDVARVLSRTVDVLKQVSFVPQLPDATRLAARRAVVAMDRTPISDLVV